MSTPTRRDFLAGTIGVGAVVILPSAPIAGLVPIEPLASLAAEDKYASSVHQLPADVHTGDFEFSLNGEMLPEDTYIEKMYAPGDERGWAVVLKPRDPDQPDQQRKAELVRGNWKIWRT